MNYFRNDLFFLLGLLLFMTYQSNAQDTTSVLFLGNSYTNANNLPNMFSELSAKAGKTVYVQEVSPGGFTFNQHSQNAGSLQKIQERKWDFVVLQEQSQIPSLMPQRETMMYPYAITLDSLIHVNSLCSRTLFFMTWAHKNGNNGLPVGSDTYEAMQQRLRSGYKIIADSLDAAIAPCGWVWSQVRQTHPSIELHTADNSHPTEAGTYLAACTFFATIFQQTASGINYYAGLTAADAAVIQDAASQIVLDSMGVWNIGLYDPDPIAAYSFVVNGYQGQFSNTSSAATNYYWDFGNGNTSVASNPLYVFPDTGLFSVRLIAFNECGSDTFTQGIYIQSTGIGKATSPQWTFFPNPANDFITLQAAYSLPDTKVRIYSAEGRLVQWQWLKNTHNTLDVSSLRPGIYVLSIETDTQNIVRKFAKM